MKMVTIRNVRSTRNIKNRYYPSWSRLNKGINYNFKIKERMIKFMKLKAFHVAHNNRPTSLTP